MIAAHPKPFFGLSDNTNLHTYLWNLDLVSYSGGTVMTVLGRGARVHPLSDESFRAACFGSGWWDPRPAETFTDIDRDWGDPATLETEPPSLPGAGWSWHGAVGPDAEPVEGRLWGGCLKIVVVQLRVGCYLPADDAAYDGCVLYLETSEELPSAAFVERLLMCLGELGLLGRFAAVLVGRPKGWSSRLATRRSSGRRTSTRSTRSCWPRAPSRCATELPPRGQAASAAALRPGAGSAGRTA